MGLVLDRTSFYADGGGQATDVGLIAASSGSLDVEHVEVGCTGMCGACGSKCGRMTFVTYMLGPRGRLLWSENLSGFRWWPGRLCCWPVFGGLIGILHVEQVRCAASVWDMITCRVEVLSPFECSAEALM